MFGLFKSKENCTTIFKEYKNYKSLFEEASDLLDKAVNKLKIYKDRILSLKDENEKLKNRLKELEKENLSLKRELKVSHLLLKDLYLQIKKENDIEELFKQTDKFLSNNSFSGISYLEETDKDEENEKADEKPNKKPQTLKEVREFLERLDIKV